MAAKHEALKLAPEIVAILNREFPKEDIMVESARPDGFRPNYIAWDKIAARLDEAFGSLWSFTIVSTAQMSEQWIVHGRLNVPVQAGDSIVEVTKDGIGTWTIEKNQMGVATDPAANLKMAASEAFKRAAILLGVGIQLYRKDVQQAQLKDQAAAVAQAPDPNQPAQPFQIANIKNLFAQYGYPDPTPLLPSLGVQKIEMVSALTVAQLLSGQHALIAWLNANAPVRPQAQPQAGLRGSNA